MEINNSIHATQSVSLANERPQAIASSNTNGGDHMKNQSQHATNKRNIKAPPIPLEKAERPSIWQRLKKSSSRPDLSLSQWQNIENFHDPSAAMFEQKDRH